jgi:hypothetical protein
MFLDACKLPKAPLELESQVGILAGGAVACMGVLISGKGSACGRIAPLVFDSPVLSASGRGWAQDTSDGDSAIDPSAATSGCETRGL